MTKSETIKAVKAWCKNKGLKLIKQPLHVYPMAYVVGYAAPRCLIVAAPWMDSEPHLQEFDKENPLTTVHLFDDSLKPGDWCSMAYVCYHDSSQQVAIPIELKAK